MKLNFPGHRLYALVMLLVSRLFCFAAPWIVGAVVVLLAAAARSADN